MSFKNPLKHRFIGKHMTHWIGNMHLWPLCVPQRLYPLSGHERSPAVFLAITFDREVLERWKHARCLQLDGTDRLICNMTFSGQVMTFTWGKSFKMTFQGQRINHSTRLDEMNTMLPKVTSWFSWVKIYYPKTFFVKTVIFNFCSIEAKPLILGH